MLCLPMSSKILALEPALHCAPNERHVKAKKKKKKNIYVVTSHWSSLLKAEANTVFFRHNLITLTVRHSHLEATGELHWRSCTNGLCSRAPQWW